MALLRFRHDKFACGVYRRIYKRSLSPFLIGTGRRKCPKCNAVPNDGFWGMASFEQGAEI
jgi:hypothetical protein